METLRTALIETALAYFNNFNKGVNVRYDSEALTYQAREKSGPSRLCRRAGSASTWVKTRF